MKMTKTMIGVFTDRSEVEKAIDALKEKQFNVKDFSIVMRDTNEAKDLSDDTGVDVAGGAVGGATTGALLGGLAGLLAAFVLPGLGAFFIGGPIASALGLTGAAASTVSGAATGALAGGLLGALMGLGLTKDEAEHYESRVKEGAILLIVPTMDRDETIVRDIFARYNASDVKSVSQNEETMRERTTQRTFADRDIDTDESETYTQQPRVQSFAHAGMKGGKSQKLANPIQIQSHLKGINYPSTKGDLIKTAESEGADESILSTLEMLPERNYDSANDVSKAVGEIE
jgi:uncharacterized membrane protein